MMSVASLHIYRWKRLTWPHPEWWTIVASAVAWLTILAQSSFAVRQVGHDHSPDGITQGLLALSGSAFSWLLMVVAMMFPMVLEPIRIVAARSLWKRRQRAILEFLVGYLGLWMLSGVAASLVVALVQQQFQVEPAHAAAFGLAIAMCWQLMPVRKRAVLACHRTIPIAATGWRADRDCLRSGWMIGVSCMVSCWALMLACLLAGHSIPVMLGAMAIGWIERHNARPNQRLFCSGLLLLALAQLMLPTFTP